MLTKKCFEQEHLIIDIFPKRPCKIFSKKTKIKRVIWKIRLEFDNFDKSFKNCLK